MKIYMQLPADVFFNNIEELLTYGFKNNPNNCGKFIQTFLNEERTLTQCYPAKRSLGDLIDICSTYFDNEFTPEEIAKCLFTLNTKLGLRPQWCDNVNKVVFRILYGDDNKPQMVKFEEYFNTHWENQRKTKGLDGYSLEDIIELIEK